MTQEYGFREKLVMFLKEYENWFVIAAKFVGMFFVFTYINGGLGQFELLDNPAVNVLLALICSIIPAIYSVLIAALIILAHLYHVSIILTILAAVVMIIVYFLFLRFSPEQVAVVLAAPVLMRYNLHFMLPILIGAFLTPYAAIPAAVGVFMVLFVRCTVQAAQITGPGITIDVTAIMTAVQTIFSQVASDRGVWLYAIVALVTAATVFVISRFSFDYVWYVAICAGAVAEIISALIASTALGVAVNFGTIIIGIVCGAVLTAILRFLRWSLDYSGKEYIQFEDDDYYYYVKAIPKFKAEYEEEIEPVPLKNPIEILREIRKDKGNAIIVDDETGIEVPVESDDRPKGNQGK